MPVTSIDVLLANFGATYEDAEVAAVETWPTGHAPFIRLNKSGERVAEPGLFGLLAPFATTVSVGRKTYNSRTETVTKLPSFRNAWNRSQRCIIPAQWIYEPCYETGEAVRWRIEQPDKVPFGIAGIYTSWQPPGTSKKPIFTFSMLTVNADGHPVMSRFHKPNDEKRMVVFLDPKDHDDWLTCSPDEAKEFCKQWFGPLITMPAPLPPKGAKEPKEPKPPKKAKKPEQSIPKLLQPKPPKPDQLDLFL